MSFLRSINLNITILIFLLLSIGILVIFSSSPTLGTQQLIFAALGLILYFLISQIDYHALEGLVKLAYLILIFSLILVEVLGAETRGVVRWLNLGFFNIQPSEFAKPILILSLASFWLNHQTNWINILKSLILVLPAAFLIFLQPGLGTALGLFVIWLGILFVAKISFRKAFVLVLILLIFIPIFWLTLHDYQRQRMASFLSPESDPLGLGYNLIQSTIAVGSGQLFGLGLGHGTQSRLQFLPEYRTDFIFATISEELGFLGSMLILLFYLLLIIFCLKVAMDSSDYFGYILACGVAILLIYQTVVNIGMNIGLFPITGITLPLISYGGSSLLSILISLGLVASVAKYRQKLTKVGLNG